MPTLNASGNGKKASGRKGGRAKAKAYDPSAGREVRYPEVKVKPTWGEKPITSTIAKELLGWQEEVDGNFGTEFFIRDLNGVKVRCLNNINNRPFYHSSMEQLKQEILMKRWAGPNGAGGTINGEPIIIGKTGLVLNGQHTLVALVLAAQEWAGPQSAHWSAYWTTEPVIDKMVVVGVDESPATTNTMDTCKPRSIMDVIYRSPYFAHLRESDRRAAARTADYAVRMLWNRTWAVNDSFAPRRTHSEAIDFIARHPKIVDAIAHVQANNAENAIGTVLSPGYASAFLYLMAASQDAFESYYGDGDNLPKEKSLKLEAWDVACDYWTAISAANIKVQPVRDAIADMLTERGEGVHLKERVAIVLKGWAAFLANDHVLPEDVELEYVHDDQGVPHLKDPPVLEGIDRGDKREQDEARALTGGSDDDQAAVEAEKEQIKQEGLAATREENKPKRSRMTVEERKAKAQRILEERAARDGSAAGAQDEGESDPEDVAEGEGTEAEGEPVEA